MGKSVSVWAVTAQNRKILAEIHASLQLNFEAIAKMLDEDDYPVEFFHQSGRSRVFRNREDLSRFISQLGDDLAQAA